MSSKHFCLKWTKFQTSILNAFESLQSSEDLADVTLTCEGISLKAHKFILSACSPYFRTIFKENPCSHPIVILKDVAYVDLIAIVNFMYHGEVMVAEEQLPSFLQTAMILQVSGLINSETPYTTLNKHSISPKKGKAVNTEPQECPRKRIKISPKATKSCPEEVVQKKANIPAISETLDDDKMKTEKQELEENNDQNCIKVDDLQDKLEHQTQTSILEAALEVKSGSILERSLTSQPTSGKSPVTPFSCENLNMLQVLPDISIPKMIFIPRKPPENDIERLILRSSSESSSSPSAFERPSELLHQTIKVEGVEQSEMEVLSSEDAALNFSKTIETPHHSSQCGNCPHCGKVYSNQSALKYHVRLVHSDLTNMYCCHLCPESFDYREGYKKHMAEAHSVRN